MTYAGVGAAFLVLGSLVIFTGLIGWWGSWRLRRAEAREAAEAVREESQEAQPAPPSAAAQGDPHLAAAIGAAVALAIEARQQEQAEEEGQNDRRPVSDGNGWREQGRIAALDARRLRDRER